MAQLLSNAQPGDEQSLAALVPVVYAELKRLAARELGRGGAGARGHTLQPTALVHEAFLNLVGSDRQWSGRDHFMAVAAKAMRQVLVDHARRNGALKRGGGGAPEAIDVDTIAMPDPMLGAGEARVVELDALLTELAGSNERTARVAEMYLFGGMDQRQIARVLGTSRMTVHRDWLIGRAWLAAKLRDAEDEC